MADVVQWPYAPNPGAQDEMWMNLAPTAPINYIGFGGPRGGGKSYGMRGWMATACMTMPLNCTIVRRTYEDLKKNHIIPMKAELKEYLDRGIIVYNGQDKVMNFPATGAKIFFMYCRTDEDLNRFQGQAYDVLGLEEAGQFPEHHITYMMSSNRPSTLMIQNNITYIPKTLCTFNWGGVGHRYIRRIFWDGAHKGDKSLYKWDPELQEGENPDNFKFIFAPFAENKPLAEKDPGYINRLRMLPEQLQRAYIDGDPDAFMGTMFNVSGFAHEVDPFHVPAHWPLYGSLDPGTGAPCSFGLYTKSPLGRLYKIFNYYVEGKNPFDHRDAIIDRIKSCEWTQPQDSVVPYRGRMPDYVVAGLDAFARLQKLAIVSSELTWEDIFREKGLYLRRAVTDRVPGAMAVQMALHYEFDSVAQEIKKKPRLCFFRGGSFNTIEELQSLERSPSNPEDIDQPPGVRDHAYDETRYMVMSAITPDDLRVVMGDDSIKDGYSQAINIQEADFVEVENDFVEDWEKI